MKGRESYFNKYGVFGCFNPECKHGLNLEVHHIVPKARGGKDEFENYIVLCYRCHRDFENHSNFRNRRVILWTWKFYFESKMEAEFEPNKLPILQQENIKPEEIQRVSSPEVLLPEVQIKLPRQYKKKFYKPKLHPKKHKRRLRKIKVKTHKHIKCPKQLNILCPICQKGFTSDGKMRQSKNHCQRLVRNWFRVKKIIPPGAVKHGFQKQGRAI